MTVPAERGAVGTCDAGGSWPVFGVQAADLSTCRRRSS
jgi:hypothetical protein